jgi:hypothetical protein
MVRRLSALVLAFTALACKKDGNDPAAATIASAQVDDGPAIVLSKTEKLASIAMHTYVYSKPSDTAKKIGYLRIGAVVPRSDKSYGNEGCPGGWYGIAPRGFVCIGKHATLDVNDPIVRAAHRRPETNKPLPYAYGFVRSVAPLYVRLPTRDEQDKAEYKIANHFRWWENHKVEEQRAPKGANDFARDLMPDAAEVPPSDTLPDGILLGGKTNEDPPPFWIENGNRSIPNVSGFEVPRASYFANRVKRHTGLAFVGTLDSGVNLDHRKFAITVDLRLVPIDKVKPETASSFHGVEMTGDLKLPVAFAKPCDPGGKGAPKPCRRAFREEAGKLVNAEQLLAPRAFLELTGNRKTVNGTVFLEAKQGIWVRNRDVGLAVIPHQWPQAAEKGEKWVDVSVEDNTLILWEGKKPTFVTVVTTGQDGMGDPQTSKSTVRGLFRIKSKHVTTTMDSNGRSAESGGAMPDPHAGESQSGEESKKANGAFELRDVPYVMYFHDGYALHSAYWHDQFGLARSHGCINLAPIDALRVFRFTEPQVPEGWHSVQAEGKGTTVIVHR